MLPDPLWLLISPTHHLFLMAGSLKPLEIVFTKADGLDIKLDVYLPEGANETNTVPILLWWHGRSSFYFTQMQPYLS